MNERIVKFAFLVPLLSLAFLPMGCKKPPPITLLCNASAPAIYPGDPLSVTATAGSVNPKKNTNVLYSWSGTGVTGTGNAATVATGPLDPGSYTAKAEVKEGKKGKEGLKPGESAQCEANYTVKAFEPPTISCSSSPTEVQPGGTTTVTAQAVSPQSRPLTYSYSASAGVIMGGGTTATFSSAGAPTGAVGITCSVSDDKSHTETANLKQHTDAKVVIVADSNAKEKDTEAKEQKRAAHNKHIKVENFAAQRAVDAKDYLVTDQGIDASRITTMTGMGDDQSAQNYLVPAGATFVNDVQGTTPVDETEVKPQERKPLPERHP